MKGLAGWPISLVCASQPRNQCYSRMLPSSTGTEESGSKRLARGTWWLVSRVRLDPIHLAAVPQGSRRCIGCRLAWPTKDAIQRTSLTGGRTRLKKGQSSQTAVSIDCGGVSAAMGSSDSDEDAFFVAGPFAYPLSCLLPVKKHPIKLVMTCLLTNAAT